MSAQGKNLALAPMAGAGLGRVLFDALLADPDFVPALKAAALGSLGASRSFYDKATREMITEPDFRTRLAAVALILSQAEGEPLRRVIHQHIGADGGRIAVHEALADSPGLREAVRRELENAEFRTRRVRPIRPAGDSGPVVDVA